MFHKKINHYFFLILLCAVTTAHTMQHAPQEPATKQITRSVGWGMLGGALFGTGIFSREEIPPHAGKFIAFTTLGGGLLGASYAGIPLLLRYTKNKINEEKKRQRTQWLEKQSRLIDAEVKRYNKKAKLYTKKIQWLQEQSALIDRKAARCAEIRAESERAAAEIVSEKDQYFAWKAWKKNQVDIRERMIADAGGSLYAKQLYGKISAFNEFRPDLTEIRKKFEQNVEHKHHSEDC